MISCAVGVELFLLPSKRRLDAPSMRHCFVPPRYLCPTHHCTKAAYHHQLPHDAGEAEPNLLERVGRQGATETMVLEASGKSCFGYSIA